MSVVRSCRPTSTRLARAGLLAVVGMCAIAPVASSAQSATRTTLACYPQTSAKPRACVVYALPGPVIQGPRVSLSDIRWSTWGAKRATGTAKLLRRGKRVSVRLIADVRMRAFRADYYYSRLTVTDRSGARQRINLEEITESS